MQDIGAIDDAERLADIVVGDQDADTAILQEADQVPDVGNGQRIDPREGFVRALLNAVGPEGDILVYNRSFEARILRELAEDKPHHATAIEGLLARLKDLAEPFAKRWYVAPGMDGRHSIKKVLPALVPELGYEDLEIGSGDLASLSFAQVVQGTYAGDETQLRRALEAYCALDTLAMVRVLRVLRRV